MYIKALGAVFGSIALGSFLAWVSVSRPESFVQPPGRVILNCGMGARNMQPYNSIHFL